MIKPLNKKKKGHGGLKFLMFLGIVGLLIVSLAIGAGTEIGQRVLGHREDRRVERTQLTPRFAYASAKLRLTLGSILSRDGSTLDITTTKDITIDRQSATASRKITITRTPTEVAPGVDATPLDDVGDSYDEVLTKDYIYQSGYATADPWTRESLDGYYYGTELDEHYIPMVDDIMGFELRSMPSKPIASDAASGFKRVTRPAVNGATPPSAVTSTYSFEMDVTTFRRAIPILATRIGLSVPSDTAVTVVIGFDDVGLMRFADVAVPVSAATKIAPQLGNGQRALYHYTLEVTEISGEPQYIGTPTYSVDAPDVTSPATTVPVPATTP
jgi:hypothetical protein